MLCRRELRRQPFMGDVGLGDDEQARRVLVDSVDDPRPRHSADPAEPPGAMVEQGVDQRAVEIAGGRMDDHPRRLVDDEQMIVLEDDVERDVLRLVMCRLGLGNGDLVGAGQRLDRGVADRRPRRIGHRPPLISAFSRSRESVGSAAASARSRRQPAASAAIVPE